MALTITVLGQAASATMVRAVTRAEMAGIGDGGEAAAAKGGKAVATKGGDAAPATRRRGGGDEGGDGGGEAGFESSFAAAATARKAANAAAAAAAAAFAHMQGRSCLRAHHARRSRS